MHCLKLKKRKDPVDMFHLTQLQRLPATVKEVEKETRNNSLFAKVLQATMSGWPTKHELNEEFLPYFNKREELIVYDGCLFWGGRVVVPPTL